MRYSIYINQPRAIEWGLNLAEVVVFTFCYDLPSWANSLTLDGENWYFASRQKAVEEIPLVSAKADTIYRHYKTLVEKGLIDWKKFDGKDYIKLTAKAGIWAKHGSISDHSEKFPKNIPENSEKFPTYNITSIDKLERGGKIPLAPHPADSSFTLKEEKENAPPPPPRPKLTPEQRAAEKAEKTAQFAKDFMARLVPFVEKYGKVMVREFYDYWTEKDQVTGEMRIESKKYKYFDDAKRLATWKRNEEKYSERNKISATTGLPTNGGELATKENTPPHTHQHFDLLQMALAKYPNTLNYARWFTVEEMERWGAERPDFLPVLHQMWTGAYMLSKMGAALSELEGSPWRKSNSEGGLFSYLVGWLNENYY